MNSKLKAMIILTIGILLGTIPATVGHAALLEPDLEAKAGILVDAKTGQVIASKNADQRLPIASVSKLLVIYLTEQAIANHKLSHDSKVKVDKKLADFSQDVSVANVPLKKGHEYTIHQLEEAALLPSSNSAAIALAQKLYGSQKSYYKAAEALLEKWGSKNVKIISACGLNDGDLKQYADKNVKDSTENKLSAQELAMVANRLITDYPNVLKITSTQEFEFPGVDGKKTKIRNTDQMLANHEYGMQGLKTGTSSNDGVNFVGVGKLNGQRVISVVLNAPSGESFSDTRALFNQAKKQTQVKKVKGHQTGEMVSAKVKNGRVQLTTDTLGVFVKKGMQPDLKEGTKRLELTQKAPLSSKKTVHQAQIKFKDKQLNDFAFNKKLNYHLKHSVKKANTFVIFWHKIVNLF